MPPQLTEQDVLNALSNVIDPEMGVSIVDLGLIYKVLFPTETSVEVQMTLATLGCPLFHVIEGDMRKQLDQIGFPDDRVTIDLTFDPPWSVDRMSESAKAVLGI